MGVGSGVGSSLGVAEETTRGTYVAPTNFYKINSSGLKKDKNIVQGAGLAAGQLVPSAAQRAFTHEGASGPINVDVATTKFGKLLRHIFGSTTAPVQQMASTAYLQTHTLLDTLGKYLTAQEGVALRSGSISPQTFKGMKVMSAEFSCKMGELLTVTLEFDGQKYSEVETLATPSYTVQIPFHFRDLDVKVGVTSGTEAHVSGVKGVSVKIERGLDTEGIYAGSLGLKDEQVTNDWVKVTGSIDSDFLDKTTFSDRFHAETGCYLIFEWVKPVAIASTYFPTIRFKMGQAFFDGDTVGLDGPDVNKQTYPFTVLDDGAINVCTAEYMSTDVTI